jgi:hypothetical protein
MEKSSQERDDGNDEIGAGELVTLVDSLKDFGHKENCGRDVDPSERVFRSMFTGLAPPQLPTNYKDERSTDEEIDQPEREALQGQVPLNTLDPVH